ncbi:MAG: crotonase/enoyl-CoA hydratase family protein [Gammaproteobacteria bacterium]
MTSCAIENGIAIISLDEGKANAVSHSLIDAVNDGLDKAESDAKAVIIRGKPGIFSAGFDLKEFKKGPVATDALVKRGTEILLRIFLHPQPVIAECTGHAIAAGAFILLAADTRFGAHGDFKIGLNETAIGFELPVFGFEFAKARLSKRHLQAAVVQAQLYDPRTAIDVGYFDAVHDEDSLHNAAMDSAKALAKLPADAYGKNKRGLRREIAAVIKASLAA